MIQRAIETIVLIGQAIGFSLLVLGMVGLIMYIWAVIIERIKSGIENHSNYKEDKEMIDKALHIVAATKYNHNFTAMEKKAELIEDVCRELNIPFIQSDSLGEEIIVSVTELKR